MRSGNIVDFKAERGLDIAWVERGNLSHILVSDQPNARPHSSIRTKIGRDGCRVAFGWGMDGSREFKCETFLIHEKTVRMIVEATT